MFILFIILIILLWKGKDIKNYISEKFGSHIFPCNYTYVRIGCICGALGGIVGSVFDMQGKGRATDSDEIILGASIVSLAAIILLAIGMAFKRNKTPGYWSRYFFNTLFYVVGFFPGVLIGSLFVWAGAILLFAMIINLGIFQSPGTIFGKSSGSSGLGIPGGEKPNHKCCASCARYINSRCAETPGKTITEPNSEYCGSFTY